MAESAEQCHIHCLVYTSIKDTADKEGGGGRGGQSYWQGVNVGRKMFLFGTGGACVSVSICSDGWLNRLCTKKNKIDFLGSFVFLFLPLLLG